MEEYSFAEVIKTETCPIEEIESEKFTLVDIDHIKTKVLHDEGQTWEKDLNSVELELANKGDGIKTEIEEYEEKPNYDQLKSEIEEEVDSLAVVSSDCDENDISAHSSIKQECDYDIHEEFEIKNVIGHGSAFGLSEEGMENSSNKLENEDITEKIDELDRLRSGKLNGSNAGKQKQFRCDSCDFATKHKFSLNAHINSIHLNIRYKCEFCDFSTAWRTHLCTHRKVKHSNGDEKQFKCDDCDFSTSWGHNLVAHRKTKHSDIILPELKCDFCEFTTIRKWNLKNHVKCVHLNWKKYKCYLCDFAASRQECIRAHIDRDHFGKKQYKCNECDYSTVWKSGLKAHKINMHIKKTVRKNLKDFKCNFCGYITHYQPYLKLHTERFHLEKYIVQKILPTVDTLGKS